MAIRRLIAGVQVIGALVGLGLLVAGAFNGGTNLLWLAMLGAHIFVGVAGVGLWRGTPGGLHLSIVAQAIQVPWIGTAHVTYRLGVGLAYWVASRDGVFTHDRSIGSSFLVGLRQGFGAWVDQTPLIVGVNLIAVAAGVFLVFTLFAKTNEDPPPSAGGISI